MAEDVSVGAFAIVPCNDLAKSRAFFERLGFVVTGDWGGYVILQGWGAEVHLQPVEPGWIEAERNAFGLFIRTPQVDAVAARVPDLIIKPGGVLRHREWGMYEFAVNAPDDLLVRVGWPSRLMQGRP